MWWPKQTCMHGGLSIEMSNKRASLQLLDITFGQHLDFKDIDNFFVNMVKKKLTHGSMTYLS